MRFDDRLTTVLGLAAVAPRDRAVQWRQLVELVARGAGANHPELLQRALDRIDLLSTEVPVAVRAAAARAIAAPRLPPALVALFLDRVETAAPLLPAIELDEQGWEELAGRASPEVQRLMSSIRPQPELALTADQELPAAIAEDPEGTPEQQEPEQQSENSPSLFRWECGPTGEIDWVEGAPRAALIGRSLADDFQQRFAARLPFSDEALVLAEQGLLAGEWKWSGTPAFFPDTGRFAGYHGTARRGDATESSPGVVAAGATQADSNRLRELIHELRTPLTAIIGFGEIIEGQILGPAHRAYRNRAAEIVRQARRLLAAVDDLDLAAKLRSGRSPPDGGTPVGELLAAVEGLLTPDLRTRLAVSYGGAALATRVRLPKDLAERLLRRFVEAVVAEGVSGDQLELTAERLGRWIGVALTLPDELRGLDSEELLDPAFSTSGQTGLGTGFALRLVRGLSIIAGGGLDVQPDTIVLRLPSASS